MTPTTRKRTNTAGGHAASAANQPRLPTLEDMKRYARGKQARRAAGRATANDLAALPPPAPHDRWLPVHIIARRLGISTRRTYTLIYEGRLEAVNFGKRLWRVSERAFCDYMERSRLRSREELGLDLDVGSGRADLPRRSRMCGKPDGE